MSEDANKLPPATLRALEALDAAPDKRLLFNDFRRATGVKRKGYYPFADRLERLGYIGRVGDNRAFTGYALTFAGMQALESHRR